jgi:hypothetical protein
MNNNDENSSVVSNEILIQKKMDKLHEAFLKSVDISASAIKDADFQECFGDTKKQLGGNLQRLYVNMIYNVSARLEKDFPAITNEFQVKSTLESLHQTKPKVDNGSGNKSSALDDPKKSIRPMIKSLKKSEIEDLTNGIKFLETEIKKSKDIAGRLRTQMLNEIEALNEENMKILHASNQSE